MRFGEGGPVVRFVVHSRLIQSSDLGVFIQSRCEELDWIDERCGIDARRRSGGAVNPERSQGGSNPDLTPPPPPPSPHASALIARAAALARESHLAVSGTSRSTKCFGCSTTRANTVLGRCHGGRCLRGEQQPPADPQRDGAPSPRACVPLNPSCDSRDTTNLQS